MRKIEKSLRLRQKLKYTPSNLIGVPNISCCARLSNHWRRNEGKRQQWTILCSLSSLVPYWEWINYLFLNWGWSLKNLGYATKLSWLNGFSILLMSTNPWGIRLMQVSMDLTPLNGWQKRLKARSKIFGKIFRLSSFLSPKHQVLY